MAARNTIWTPDKVRERIRTTQLVNRLQAHVDGKVQMTPQQVRSAEILLRKTLPDLTAVEHSGFIETPPTREEVLARLTQLHAAATQRLVDGGANRAAEPVGNPSALN